MRSFFPSMAVATLSSVEKLSISPSSLQESPYASMVAFACRSSIASHRMYGSRAVEGISRASARKVARQARSISPPLSSNRVNSFASTPFSDQGTLW